MKRTVTPEARASIHAKMTKAMMQTAIDMPAMIRAVTDAACEWYEQQNTFTDAITTDEKTCPTCGAMWVISKRILPRYLIRPLRILADAGRPMKTKELADLTHILPVYSKFSWLVHWGLTEKVEGSIYRITEKGRQFLRGEITVPAFLWMLKNKVVPTPEGCEHPHQVFFYQLAAGDTDDRTEHVERSAPAATV